MRARIVGRGYCVIIECIPWHYDGDPEPDPDDPPLATDTWLLRCVDGNGRDLSATQDYPEIWYDSRAEGEAKWWRDVSSWCHAWERVIWSPANRHEHMEERRG